MMETVSLSINGTIFEVEKSITILEAAQIVGIYIPRLCAHPDLPPMPGMTPMDTIFQGVKEIKNENIDQSPQGHEGCQLCTVNIEGMNGYPTSCSTSVEENMIIWTESPEIKELRLEKMMHLLSTHPHACLTCAQQEGCSREPCSTNVPVEERCCPEFGRCELQKVAEYIGIREDTQRYRPQGLPNLDGEPLFIRNYELCIGCTRCVRVCNEIRGVGALGYVGINGDTKVGSIAPTLMESNCKFCGACIEVCPTGALTDKDIVWSERERALVPCRDTCPLGTDVPRYIHHIADGKFGEAAAVIREKTPFPASLGRICFHTCEETCRRGQINDPIAICALKRFAIDQKNAIEEPTTSPAPSTGRKVAVVGSGPAGLTAAYYLAKIGHSVTVFEATSQLGGMLTFGIPEYRLPQEILQEDLDHIVKMGVEIKTEAVIGEHIKLNELRTQGHEAIFVAIGAQHPKKLNIEGVELEGVHWGVDFLKQVNLGNELPIKDRVLIVGGGNVAIDVALTARRLGAKEIQLICLESRSEMPAHEWEIQDALEEDIQLNFSWGPKKILATNGKVSGVEIVQCNSVFDIDGTFNPKFDETNTKIIDTDMVILAIGQTPDLSILNDESSIITTPDGLISVNDRDTSTNTSGIYAGGEATCGPSSVVEAIEIGRKAANSIDKYLGGTGDINRIYTDNTAINPYLGREEDFYDRKRVQMPRLDPTKRINSFKEIERGYDEIMAKKEANRCLRCDLRFELQSVMLPPEKWYELTTDQIRTVPETEGAYQLLDKDKKVIAIVGTPNLQQALVDQLNANEKACYFGYEEDPMYTKRESELLQQHMQQFGSLPGDDDELDDLF